MEKKNISSQLRSNIKEYLSYYWDEERGNLTEKEQKIIRQLPESLKKELKVEANKIVLKDNPIFHQNFSKFINDKICGIIQEQRCHPEQIIMKEDEQDDCSIYFIQKGRVEVFIKQTNHDGTQSFKSIMILGKGQYFGTYGFFTGLTRKQSIRCMEFSQFLVIKRSDFIETLKQFSDDYEKFCMLKDQLMFNSKNKGIDQSCYGCGSKEHFFLECPSIHYAPDQQEIIKKYNFTSIHYVRRYQKRRFFKHHTLKEMDSAFRDGIKFIEQNESFLLEQEWLQSASEEDRSEDDDNTSDSYNDSREDLDYVDKNHVLGMFNTAQNNTSPIQMQQTAIFQNQDKNSNILNQTDSKVESNIINTVNEVDENYKSQQLDDKLEKQAQWSSTKETKQTDDFNLKEQNPSSISKIRTKRVDSEVISESNYIEEGNSNIQQTQKIKLNPHNSTLLQEQQLKQQAQKKEEQQIDVKNKELNLAESSLKPQSQTFIDVSLGPNQTNFFNMTFKQDSERVVRRMSYWNMKVNTQREIQIPQEPQENEQQILDKNDREKNRKSSNFNKDKSDSNNQFINDILSHETKSINGDMQKDLQTFNQTENHLYTNASLDLQSNFTKSKILMGDLLNISDSKSLPQIPINQEEINGNNLLCVFDINRFDDVEGTYASKKKSPEFQPIKKRNSQIFQLEDDLIQNFGGETERGLLDNSFLNESSDKNSKLNGKTNQDDKQQNKKFGLVLKQNLIGTDQKDDIKVEYQNQIQKNVQEKLQEVQVEQNDKQNNQFDLRIPIQQIISEKELQSSEQKITPNQMVPPDLINYKKLPVQKKQVTHSTSIELNQGKPLGNQLQNANHRQSVQYFQSNLMLNSLQTQNNNSKSQFTNSNLPSNQQSAELHQLAKLGKSNRNLMFGSLYNKDKQQNGITDQMDQKAIKREKFWKNVQKHGYDMGATDVSSPLILKAKKKLVEINSEGDQVYGVNNKLKTKSSQNTISFSNQNQVEDRFNFKGGKNLKKDYSPTSSVLSLKKLGTDYQIQSHDNSQIEQLKQMMSNLLLKFDEMKGQPSSGLNIMSRKSIVFDRHSPLIMMQDYIDENKNNQIQNSPLIQKYQPNKPQSPLIPQQYPPNFRSEELINSNNMYNQEFIQEIIFDTMKNYSQYFPQNNILYISQELNKISTEKLKQMKKQKIKKAKASYQLFSSLEHLSKDQQFKRRILNSKFARQNLIHNARQEQSEEELNSERSRSNSGSNSKRRSLFYGGVNENFSHAVNSFKTHKRASCSLQSINNVQQNQPNQTQQVIPTFQKFSHFKN